MSFFPFIFYFFFVKYSCKNGMMFVLDYISEHFYLLRTSRKAIFGQSCKTAAAIDVCCILI